MIDIIWNHCSVDAQWILEEPNCYYSPQNTPMLGAAFKLDSELFDLSCKFSTLNITDSRELRTWDDVHKTLDYIRREIIEKNKFQEYFHINKRKLLDDLTNHYKATESAEYVEKFTSSSLDLIFVETDEYDLMKLHMKDFGKSPHGVQIDFAWFTNYLNKRVLQLNIHEVFKLFRHINNQMTHRVHEWIDEMMESIKGELIYRFLQCNQTVVSKEYPLITRYFYNLKNNDFAALNGYVANYSASEDFTTSSEQYYFRRRVVVWSDLIKLNYQTIEKCPKLWKRMNEYTVKMASIFDGFRLDNFHNTNILTAKYFINNAIETNESLLLLCELFTNSPVTDASFCLRVGVHRLVREIQNCYSLSELVNFLNGNTADAKALLTQIPALSINNYSVSFLKPTKPLAILYDQTHDNASYFQKFNIFVTLPLMAISNFESLMIGSVRGFDELFLKHIPVTCTLRYPRLISHPTKIDDPEPKVIFVVNPADLSYLISPKV